MNFSFKKKNIFISGGTHGIGLACVENFLKYGGQVITFSRNSKNILTTKKKFKRFKDKIHIYKGDILDRNFIEDLSKTILKKFKKIDVLVHNVGGGGRWGQSSIQKNDFRVWDEVYRKNNDGLILFTKHFIDGMIKKKWGRVIAISSICGIETLEEDRPWFAAAKSAQNSIIKNLSKKKIYCSKNITFNSVSPGPIFIKGTGWEAIKKKNNENFLSWIKKEIPVNKMGTTQDVANAVIFFASNYSKFINGSNLVIDGGKTSAII